MSDVKIAIENRLAMVMYQREVAQQQVAELDYLIAELVDGDRGDEADALSESAKYAERKGRVHMWTQTADELNGLSKDLGINNVVRAAESIMVRIRINRGNGMSLQDAHAAAVEDYRNH